VFGGLEGHIACISSRAAAFVQHLKRDIDASRDAYRPVALRGSVLYFVMGSLSAISPMYEYSLDAFREIYIKSIVEAVCARSPW